MLRWPRLPFFSEVRIRTALDPTLRSETFLKTLLLFLAIIPVNLPFARLTVSAAPPPLRLYFIDVEGGAATLIVTPAGESILLDTGWDGFEGRDARRIERAMRMGGVRSIDHLVTSHYHRDHYGGVSELSKLVTIRNFYDHGPMSALSEDPEFALRYGAYRAAANDQTITLKAGDSIPLTQMAGTPLPKLLCVASNASVLDGTAPPNPECSSLEGSVPADSSENGRSVALRLSFGDFDFLNLADLTWPVSQKLICPRNQLTDIDLYQVTHHGGSPSNNPILLRGIRPTAAVIINAPRKGGEADTIRWLRELPSLKALYTLHSNAQISAEQNTPTNYIANIDNQPDAGWMIVVSVDAKKSKFSITNERTGKTEYFKSGRTEER